MIGGEECCNEDNHNAALAGSDVRDRFPSMAEKKEKKNGPFSIKNAAPTENKKRETENRRRGVLWND